MKASVKIMLSYDYSHFEIALSSDDDLDLDEVNGLRKDAQRLADEAVRQYKKAKIMAQRREGAQYEKDSFLRRVEEIKEKPEQERTIREMAILKQHADEKWEEQFEYPYDYEDDYDQEATP